MDSYIRYQGNFCVISGLEGNVKGLTTNVGTFQQVFNKEIVKIIAKQLKNSRAIFFPNCPA